MIRVGLAGWGDHGDIYTDAVNAQGRLRAYGRYFDLVEVDSSFYAVQAEKSYERWVEETPDGFQFVVKAYQGMTGHLRGRNPFPDTETMFEAFFQSIRPVREAGKLRAVLFQYPPWFDCTRENVAVLRDAKTRVGDCPVALEFRHQSWFSPEFRERTMAFMREAGWMHSVCDEPQVLPGSVPTVLEAANPEATIVRFHGRNAGGWTNKPDVDWRAVRYLYQYSTEELTEWVGWLRQLEAQCREVCVIFNNNSGGHAAKNALELMDMLGLPHPDLPAPSPVQLDLFE
ncbi:DUF72 domain-containing protein [Paenibacillus koleovorans]|uniref:DUF72 domain-containing protein n=1 Tax=Paenibacillus koleovorans TaxID=121608 RepID=UPI000FD85B31|nr:DUF72 domain-containing protein [Paenibacillus koleovorans]